MNDEHNYDDDYRRGSQDVERADNPVRNYDGEEDSDKYSRNSATPGIGANASKKRDKKSAGVAGKILLAVALGLVFGVVSSVVFVASNKVFNKALEIVEEKIEPETKKSHEIEKIEEPDNEESLNEQSKDDDSKAKKEHVKEPKERKESEEANKPDEDRTQDDSDSVEKYKYDSVADVVKETMPSIVAITTKSVQEVMSIYGFGTRQYESEGAGSGIIIGDNDSELLIVTNNHVVEGATTLSVCFIDDEVCPAEIKGTSANKDLAIVAVKKSDIKDSTNGKIKIAEIGNSDELVIGEQVVAIGNALGYGQSVTTGIVSALNRSIKDGGDNTEYIQTDAAINPGNSGGALLDMNGKLVGINSAKLSSTQIEGMGYAIPISVARPILDGLMNLTTRPRLNDDEAGYIGISGMSVNSEVAKQYGMPEGIYVSEATSGEAAEKAGIQKGDIIIKFDGVGVNSISELRERLNYYRVGEAVEVTIARTDDGEYKERDITVILGSRKKAEENASNNNQSDNGENHEEQDKNPGYEQRRYEIPGFGDYSDIFDYFFN